jgi:thiosulfate/3-mercaptopyruvate sulfurtransferase
MSYTSLINVENLQANLTRADWVIVDCRFQLNDPAAGKKMYVAGHLPGARFADLDHDLSSPITAQSGRHPLPNAHDFMQRLGAWGIHPHTQIVAYDHVGGPFAAHFWWLARWVGHRHVAVLDGGFPAWQAAGLPLETEAPTITPCEYAGHADAAAWLTTGEVQQNLSDHSFQVIDAREAERYLGRAEPIDPVAGHVPGALNLPFKENLDSQGKFLPAAALQQRFAAVIGKRTPSSIVHMCGSGVTACHNVLAMEAAGLSGSKLYAGSWSEWIRDPARPIDRE